MQEQIEKENMVVHSPIIKGDCLECHSGHNSAYQGLLTAQERNLCIGCHNVEGPEFPKSHMGIPAAESNCLICHDPHMSEEEGLFLPHIHLPFIEKNCRACHE